MIYRTLGRTLRKILERELKKSINEPWDNSQVAKEVWLEFLMGEGDAENTFKEIMSTLPQFEENHKFIEYKKPREPQAQEMWDMALRHIVIKLPKKNILKAAGEQKALRNKDKVDSMVLFRNTASEICSFWLRKEKDPSVQIPYPKGSDAQKILVKYVFGHIES